MKTYGTSEMAGIIGIHPNTVMLYEKWGYIAPVERKENGYRVYTETHLEQIKLVRMALRRDVMKWYMKFEVQNILRRAAQGDLRKALELSRKYLAHMIPVQKPPDFLVQRQELAPGMPNCTV